MTSLHGKGLSLLLFSYIKIHACLHQVKKKIPKRIKLSKFCPVVEARGLARVVQKFQILSKFWKFWIIFLLSQAKANICQSVLLLLTQFVVKDFKNVLQL